jgi:hypothetical protein
VGLAGTERHSQSRRGAPVALCAGPIGPQA